MIYAHTRKRTSQVTILASVSASLGFEKSGVFASSRLSVTRGLHELSHLISDNVSSKYIVDYVPQWQRSSTTVAPISSAYCKDLCGT